MTSEVLARHAAKAEKTLVVSRELEAYGAAIIYAVQAEDGGPIKIGMSTNMAARLRGLQTGNPSRLKVLAAALSRKSAEIWLHRRLRPYRLCGEWFIEAEETLLIVDAIRQQSLDGGTVLQEYADAPVVHSRHGQYADMDARRAYRREWMRNKRASGA